MSLPLGNSLREEEQEEGEKENNKDAVVGVEQLIDGYFVVKPNFGDEKKLSLLLRDSEMHSSHSLDLKYLLLQQEIDFGLKNDLGQSYVSPDDLRHEQRILETSAWN